MERGLVCVRPEVQSSDNVLVSGYDEGKGKLSAPSLPNQTKPKPTNERMRDINQIQFKDENKLKKKETMEDG